MLASLVCTGLPVANSASSPPSPNRLDGRLLLFPPLDWLDGCLRIAADVKKRSGESGVPPAVPKRSVSLAPERSNDGCTEDAGGGVSLGKKDDDGRDPSSRMGDNGVEKKDVVSMLFCGEPNVISLGVNEDERDRLPPPMPPVEPERVESVELASDRSDLADVECDRLARRESMPEGVGLRTPFDAVGLIGSSLPTRRAASSLRRLARPGATGRACRREDDSLLLSALPPTDEGGRCPLSSRGRARDSDDDGRCPLVSEQLLMDEVERPRSRESAGVSGLMTRAARGEAARTAASPSSSGKSSSSASPLPPRKGGDLGDGGSESSPSASSSPASGSDDPDWRAPSPP